jgi:chromosome partitioning protein
MGESGRIYMVGGDKGGVGKSTMAAMLAATLAGARHRQVTLIDTDDTRDVSGWLATRAVSWPKLPRIDGQHVTENIGDAACQARELGDVVLDVGGRDAEALRVGMSVADVLLMPIAPGQFDLFSCKRMARRVSECRRWNRNLRAVFFVNKAETNSSLRSLNDEAAELCRSFAPVVETATARIHRRIAFGRAASDGLGVLELATGDRQAADEFWELLIEIEPELKENADGTIQS